MPLLHFPLHRAAIASTVAVLGLSAGSAEARPAGGVYAGTTKGGWPVMFEISRDGRAVSRAVGALEARCTDGVVFTLPESYEDVPVRRSGAFRASYDTGPIEDEGKTGRLTGSLNGRLDRRRREITGSMRFTLTLREHATGSETVCETGAVKFLARD